MHPYINFFSFVQKDTCIADVSVQWIDTKRKEELGIFVGHITVTCCTANYYVLLNI